jgi:hypothetical protein
MVPSMKASEAPHHTYGLRQAGWQAAVLFATIASVLPGDALAGAWPREPGKFFLSLRTEIENTEQGNSRSRSIYGEYGLTPRFTLGGQFSQSNLVETRPRALVFGRFAIGNLKAADRFAIGLGASVATDSEDALDALYTARAETALYYGRGFGSRFGDGWLALSARLMVEYDNVNLITDFGALIGLRPYDGWMTMLSLSSYSDEDGTYRKLSPSVGYQLRDNVWGVLQVTQQISGGSDSAVGLSVWINF